MQRRRPRSSRANSTAGAAIATGVENSRSTVPGTTYNKQKLEAAADRATYNKQQVAAAAIAASLLQQLLLHCGSIARSKLLFRICCELYYNNSSPTILPASYYAPSTPRHPVNLGAWQPDRGDLALPLSYTAATAAVDTRVGCGKMDQVHRELLGKGDWQMKTRSEVGGVEVLWCSIDFPHDEHATVWFGTSPVSQTSTGP